MVVLFRSIGSMQEPGCVIGVGVVGIEVVAVIVVILQEIVRCGCGLGNVVDLQGYIRSHSLIHACFRSVSRNGHWRCTSNGHGRRCFPWHPKGRLEGMVGRQIRLNVLLGGMVDLPGEFSVGREDGGGLLLALKALLWQIVVGSLRRVNGEANSHCGGTTGVRKGVRGEQSRRTVEIPQPNDNLLADVSELDDGTTAHCHPVMKGAL